MLAAQLGCTGRAALRAKITMSEYRDWVRHYQRSGFVPQALRGALARNSQLTLAAMHGSDKAGQPRDYLVPALDADARSLADHHATEAALDAEEERLGL